MENILIKPAVTVDTPRSVLAMSSPPIGHLNYGSEKYTGKNMEFPGVPLEDKA